MTTEATRGLGRFLSRVAHAGATEPSYRRATSRHGKRVSASVATPTSIRPISHPSTNDKVFSLVGGLLRPESRVVDVGAGEGYFSMMIGDEVSRRFGIAADQVVSACDVFPALFRYPAVLCKQIPDDGRLPYDDAAFDIACSLEVVEHVEDQFRFAREIYRVLRPGGIAIISTPNVLNMNSRLRQLHSGFAVLFDPLLLSSTDPVHTSGHIHPVSYYYLAYQLGRAGFTSVEPHYDRFKTSATLLLAINGAFVVLGNALFRARLRRKRPQVALENRSLLAAINSLRMLTSRSVIAVATK